jgi:hypothetical protein
VINTKNSEVNGTQKFFKFYQFMKLQILKGQIYNFLELHFKNPYDRITSEDRMGQNRLNSSIFNDVE